jgi:hypothetical protein
MHFWQFILQEDESHDLANKVAASKWLAGGEQISEKPLHPKALGTWINAVQALRSLAPRLKRVRCRPSSLSPSEADMIFDSFLENLRPVVTRKGDDLAPYTSRSVLGVKLHPDILKIMDSWSQICEDSSIGAFIEQMWTEVFGSLISDDFAPVCAACGKPLGLTPKGRRPRRGMCSKCRFNAWYKKQSQPKLRERWRANKVAERSRQEGR